MGAQAVTRKLAGATTETIPKAAAHFGVSLKRLRKAIEAGEVACMRPRAGSPLRVKLDEVAAWIARENVPREHS